MRILFIGGTGVISAACVARSLADGHETYVLNRGKTSIRRLPRGAHSLHCDVNNVDDAAQLLRDLRFDAVVDFLAFTEYDVRNHVSFLPDGVDQYILISSASVYHTPSRLPITESCALGNPFQEYAQKKIAAELAAWQLFRDDGLPVTVVRPSATYDATRLPFFGKWTTVARIAAGRDVIVHGDGSALWTLTHSDDFAAGLLPLAGNPDAVGESFHITSSDVLTWNQIVDVYAAAMGVPARIVHVPTDAIAQQHPSWGAGLHGDKVHSKIFDTSKLRSVVPGFAPRHRYVDTVPDIVAWYQAEPGRMVIDQELDDAMDELSRRYRISNHPAASSLIACTRR